MTRPLALAVVLAGLAVAGCGSGPEVVQERRAEAFTRVQAEGSIDVEVQVGPAASVTVRAGEKVIDDVVTEIEDGTLVVSTRDRGIVIGPDGFGGAEVAVTVPRLTGVSSQGSSDLGLSSLDGGRLRVDLQGSGNVEAAGRVAALDLDLQGSGDADLVELVARRVRVSLQGSGDVRVNARDFLDATTQGSGDLSYRGTPRLRSSTTGSGDIGPE